MSTETHATTTSGTGRPEVIDRVTNNWCGYMIKGPVGSMQSVSATWMVPQPLTGQPEDTVALSAIWVGLNGCSSASVCLTQAGSDVNSSQWEGQPLEAEYDSWYELEETGDTGAVELGANYPVSAGDRITSTITHVIDLEFTIALSNATKNWTYEQNHSFPSTSPTPLMDSAEIIVEAPIWAPAKAIGRLTNFGTVTFEEITVNAKPLTGFVQQAVALTMVNNTALPADGDNLLAKPGTFGDPFTVTWHNYGKSRAPEPIDVDRG